VLHGHFQNWPDGHSSELFPFLLCLLRPKRFVFRLFSGERHDADAAMSCRAPIASLESKIVSPVARSRDRPPRSVKVTMFVHAWVTVRKKQRFALPDSWPYLGPRAHSRGTFLPTETESGRDTVDLLLWYWSNEDLQVCP